MKKKHFILITLIGFCSTVFGQNLVLDGGFENTSSSLSGNPQNDANLMTIWNNSANVSDNYPSYWKTNYTYDVVYWKWEGPQSISDPFWQCRQKAGPETPKIPAVDGNSYAGIETVDERQYLVGVFSEPLVEGECYRVSFSVRNGKDIFSEGKRRIRLTVPSSGRRWWRGYLSNNVGVYITDNLPSRVGISPTQQDPLAATPQYNITHQIAHNDWEVHEFDYVANGGETYIIIGNFFTNAQTSTTSVWTHEGCMDDITDKHAHHLIDAVSVQLKRNMKTFVQDETWPATHYGKYVYAIVAGENVTSSKAPGKVTVPFNSNTSPRWMYANYEVNLNPGFEAHGLFLAEIVPSECNTSSWAPLSEIEQQFIAESEMFSNESVTVKTLKTETTLAEDRVEQNHSNQSIENRFLELYPNPFNDQIVIRSLFNEVGHITLNVYDVSGKLLIKEENAFISNSGYQVKTSDWKNGAYIIELISEHGKQVERMLKY